MLCKHHFAMKIKQQLQRAIIKTYRIPENAFNQMDFSGRGYILQEDFLNKYMLLRANIKLEDALLCLKMTNMFINKEVNNFYVPPNGMTFDSFKKNFFPHLCMVAEDD